MSERVGGCPECGYSFVSVEIELEGDRTRTQAPFPMYGAEPPKAMTVECSSGHRFACSEYGYDASRGYYWVLGDQQTAQ